MEGNGGRMSRGEQMCLCVGVSTCAKLAWAEREKRSIEKREVLSVGIGVVWEVVAVLHSKETSQVNFPNLLQGFSVIVDLPYFWHGSVHTKLACDARGIYQLVSKKRGCRQPFSPALLKQTPSSNKHYNTPYPNKGKPLIHPITVHYTTADITSMAPPGGTANPGGAIGTST